MKIKFYHLTLVLFILVIGVMAYLYFSVPKAPKDMIVVSASTKEWTKEPVTVTVESTVLDKVKEYSFDGGNTYQSENTIVLDRNRELTVIVRYKNNAISNKIVTYVKNIDNDGPAITFDDNIEVLINTENFDLMYGVSVKDLGIGLDGNVSITPNSLDTSTLGKYDFTYTAKDLMDNVTEITRTISVVDKLTNNNNNNNNKPYIQYRYRDKITETYDCSEEKVDVLTEDPLYQFQPPCTRITDGDYCLAASGSEPIDDRCNEGYRLYNSKCHQVIGEKKPVCGSSFLFDSATSKCKKTETTTISKTCQRDAWTEWSLWSSTIVTESATRQVETRNIGE